MTAAQLSMLEKQFLECNVLEKAKLPRLSLYYMRDTARGTGGND
jgi:hypothetical protein